MAELKLTHLEISLKIASHSPALSFIFFTVLRAAHYKMPSKTARDCQFIYWFSPGLTATLRIPDTPTQRAFAHTQVFINGFMCDCGSRSEGRFARLQVRLCPPILLVNSPSQLTFEEKKKKSLPEIFPLISRRLIRLEPSPEIQKAAFFCCVSSGTKSLDG